MQPQHNRAALSGDLAGKAGKQRSAFGTVRPNCPLTTLEFKVFLDACRGFSSAGQLFRVRLEP
jgi:hypothetical protein